MSAWAQQWLREVSERLAPNDQALVIPLYGSFADDLAPCLEAMLKRGLAVIVVDNNPLGAGAGQTLPCTRYVLNENRGGQAGGLNRGVEAAIGLGARWITLLDQDSRLEASDVVRLTEPWTQGFRQRWVVGPTVWDQDRDVRHGRRGGRWGGWHRTRLLISSGTTFQASDWPELGAFDEQLFIDFVDHLWCFRAQARGFQLWQHDDVVMRQCFGQPHPNPVCRYLGMQLYSPLRHYYSLRNLNRLLRHRDVPLDLKLKELIKMLVKPWLWLVFEPSRQANAKAIVAALRDGFGLNRADV